MKIERTKNTIKNIKAGMFLKIYQIVVPFFMRTAMLYFMGVQYLGLNSLFASILQVLNMAELGVGSAMVFAMYKPIAQDDEKTICALMKLYRKYYRMIGSLIGVVGVMLTPVIPELISGEIPAELNVYALYLLNLAATVLTYWLVAYKNCLLQAHQRTDIVSNITAATYTVQWVIQLAILLVIKNYYWYVIVTLATQVINNIATAVATGRMFPRYRPEGNLKPEEIKIINGKIRDLFTAKLGSVILKSSDTIIISAFLGLTILAIYQNYFFMVSAVLGMVEIILASMMAGLGNSYVLETKEKNYQDLEKFTFLFLWLTGVCTCCFLGMYQPFMKIWVGRELMLDFGAVICFAGYFYAFTLNRLLSIYKDAAGLWHEDRFRPMVTSFVNLFLNLLWVRNWGIYGVLLSTVISMAFVGMPWLLRNLFTIFFDKTMMLPYVQQILKQTGAAVLAGAVVSLICHQIKAPPIIALICCAVVSVAVPNVLFYLLFWPSRQFRAGIAFADQITKGRFKLESWIFR